jgi:hypothetical protein
LEGADRVVVGNVERVHRDVLRDAGVAGRALDCIDLGIAQQRRDDCVLARAGTDDEHLHSDELTGATGAG